jgi:F0F1-type ATP synthase membrane subunit b/b'
MPDEFEASDAYDKARDKADAALEAYAKKDEPKGDKLIEQAQSLDPDAVKDVMDELEDDAAAEHDPKALKQKLTSRPGKPAS